MTADRISALLEPIQNRLNAAIKLGEWEVRGKDVVIYDPKGYGAHRIVAWVDHPEYTDPIAAAPTDQARLLAAVQAVLAVADRWEEDFPHKAWQVRTALIRALEGETA